MEIFLNNIISFPMVVYTFLLAIIIVYWLLAMLGAVDIEIFDADLDIDVDLEVDGDGNVDIDPKTEGLGGVTGFMLKWGLTGVPVTVVFSILIASAWLICYLAASMFLPVLLPLLIFDVLKTLAGVVLLVVCFALAIPVTAQFIKPLKSAFVSYTAKNKASFIGSECVVKTGRVSEDFGQAEFDDGGAGMLFDVRANSSDEIKKGDQVILKSYDEEDGSYWVIKTTDFE